MREAGQAGNATGAEDAAGCAQNGSGLETDDMIGSPIIRAAAPPSDSAPRRYRGNPRQTVARHYRHYRAGPLRSK